MRVLFLVPYPTEGASNRVRVEQFLPYLAEHGVKYLVRPFMTKRFFRILYLPRHIIEKAFWFIYCTFNRVLDLMRALRYDIIFIHREAYPLGGAFFEHLIHGMGKTIVFDFDDAIFLQNTSSSNSYIEQFKSPEKIAHIIRLSRHVIAGNNYLKNYAVRYNQCVTVIPTSIDMNKFHPSNGHAGRDKIVIGWIGSATTREFLYTLEDVFAALSARYPNVIFRAVGASFYSSRVANVENKPWSLETEADDLRNFDIGVMPLHDNEWTRGKCGFKLLLYMACGLPVVASPVGMNLEIVDEFKNGFFASTKEEWVEKLSRLIEDERLRHEMGESGKEKVAKRYSLDLAKTIFYQTLLNVREGR